MTAPFTAMYGVFRRTITPVRRRACVWTPEPMVAVETSQKVVLSSLVTRTLSSPPPRTVTGRTVTFPGCIVCTQLVSQLRSTSFCPYSAAARACS